MPSNYYDVVDTVRPTVTLVTANPITISDEHEYSLPTAEPFEVRITYSEVMDSTTDPAIAYALPPLDDILPGPPDGNPDIFINPNGVWELGDTRFYKYYDIVNTDEATKNDIDVLENEQITSLYRGP